MYPTPRASGQENPESLIKRKGLREAMQHNLTAAVQLMYPTPRTSGGSRPNGKGGKVLEEEVMIQEGLRERGKTLNQMYPTPKARDYRGEEGKRVIKTKTGWSKERKGSKVRYGASLNDVMEYQMMYPTPTKGMHKQDVNDNGEYARRIKSKGNQIMLPAHVKLYPTPQAADWKNMDTAKQKMLSSEVKLYPTPRVSDTEGGVVKNVELNNGSFSRKNKQGTRWGVKLKDAVNYLEENEMYPTPTQDSASERTKKYKQGGTPLVMAVKKNAKVTGARLSPSFVEFLMGFPPQWTETEHQD